MNNLKLVPDWYIRAAQLSREIRGIEREVEWYLAQPKSKKLNAEFKEVKLKLKTKVYELEQLEQNL